MGALRRFAERSVTTVAGIYRDADTAHRAVQALPQLPWGPGMVARVVTPGDPEMARKLDPSGCCPWRATLRSNLGCTVAFMLVGALAGFGFATPGVLNDGMVVWLVPVATSVAGGLFGMVYGVLLTPAPDRELVSSHVRRASRAGCWAVVAHTADGRGATAVRDALGRAGGLVVSAI